MKEFCYAPWISMHIRPDGSVYPCCISSYCLGNIKDKTWEEIQKSTELVKLKEGFHRRDKDILDQCGKCHLYTADGGGSPRIRYNRMYESYGPSTLDVDIRLSNKCNLACRMCGSYASSKWEKELGVREPKLSSRDRKNLVTLVKENANRISNLNLVGGEPTIIPEFFEILTYLVEGGYATKIELCFNTNLQQFPKQFYELTKAFKLVDLAVSIDAVGEVGEWIRTGSSWEKTKKNLDRLQEFYKDMPNVKICLAPTVSILNIFQIDELFGFGLGRNLFVLDGNLLFDPKELCIANLSERVKKKIKAHILTETSYLREDTKAKIVSFLESRKTLGMDCKTVQFLKEQSKKVGKNYFEIAEQQKHVFTEEVYGKFI